MLINEVLYFQVGFFTVCRVFVEETSLLENMPSSVRLNGGKFRMSLFSFRCFFLQGHTLQHFIHYLVVAGCASTQLLFACRCSSSHYVFNGYSRLITAGGWGGLLGLVASLQLFGVDSFSGVCMFSSRLRGFFPRVPWFPPTDQEKMQSNAIRESVFPRCECECVCV